MPNVDDVPARVVTIDGPTRSGRATLAKLLAQQMEDQSIKAIKLVRREIILALAKMVVDHLSERYQSNGTGHKQARIVANQKLVSGHQPAKDTIALAKLLDFRLQGGIACLGERPIEQFRNVTLLVDDPRTALDRDPDMHAYVTKLITTQIREFQAQCHAAGLPGWVCVAGLCATREISSAVAVELTVRDHEAAQRLHGRRALSGLRSRNSADNALRNAMRSHPPHLFTIAGLDTGIYRKNAAAREVFGQMKNATQLTCFPELR